MTEIYQISSFLTVSECSVPTVVILGLECAHTPTHTPTHTHTHLHTHTHTPHMHVNLYNVWMVLHRRQEWAWNFTVFIEFHNEDLWCVLNYWEWSRVKQINLNIHCTGLQKRYLSNYFANFVPLLDFEKLPLFIFNLKVTDFTTMLVTDPFQLLQANVFS